MAHASHHPMRSEYWAGNTAPQSLPSPAARERTDYQSLLHLLGLFAFGAGVAVVVVAPESRQAISLILQFVWLYVTATT